MIGFDLNGVLAEANIPLCDDIKQKYGLTINPNSLTTYGEIGHRLAEYINNPRQAHRWVRDHINSPEFILKLTPIEGSQELWRSIKDKRIASGHSTNPETIIATERWLAMHGFDVRPDFTKYKDAWARQIRADYVVEDSPLHARDLAEAHIHVFLLDKPYNKIPETPFITRIARLLDIIAYLDRLEGTDLP